MQGLTSLASCGELVPCVAAHVGVRVQVAGFVLCLDDMALAKRKGPARSVLKMSACQPVSRDFAFLLDADIAASDLLRAVKSAVGPMLSDIQLFDLYQGKGIEDGKKSIAVTITLTPQKATLTEYDIEAISSAVVKLAEKNCGAVLRG